MMKKQTENYMALAKVRQRFGPTFDKILTAGLRATYRLGVDLSNGLADLTPERVASARG
jgi:hypothetical protein